MLRLKIEQDTNCESPRTECDMASRVFIPQSNRYLLGDKDAVPDPPPGSVILALYMYAHSGVTVWCEGEPAHSTCPWDSGQVGIAYITPEVGRHEFGRVWRKRSADLIRAEVQTWDSWLRGDCYGFVIEDENENCVDSCWGFIGDESYCREEGESALKYAQESRNKEDAKEEEEKMRAACSDIVTV